MPGSFVDSRMKKDEILSCDSRFLPNVDFARSHHGRHHRLVLISSYQSCDRPKLISVFSASKELRAIQWSVTDFGC
jgi:hypothetical protein